MVISDIQPDLAAEPYVFTAGEPPPGVSPFAVIREDEGVTVILTRAVADQAGLRLRRGADHAAGQLRAADVGLTALFSRTLAGPGSAVT